MTAKYSTGVRFNHTFGPLEVWSFFGEGVGGVLYLAGVAAGSPLLEWLGLGFVVAAVLVLLSHLGKPGRSWRTITRLGSAWVSRGTLAIGLFTAFAALSLVASLLGFLQPYQTLATWIAVVIAFPMIIYAGMMLRSIRAIRLWRSALLPASFVAHSAATGLTLAFGVAAVTGQGLAPWLCPAAIAALVAAAVLSALHLSNVESSAGTQASLRRLQSGDLRQRFVVGAGVVGIAVPLAALAIVALTGAAVVALAVVAAVSRFYGDYMYRLSVVTAGAYEPIFPAQAEYFARGPRPATRQA